MNVGLFDEMMQKGRRPSQNYSEWKMFLEICEMEMKKRGILKPMVVEIGMWRNRQKKFYETFLEADHISIDISSRRGIPDLLGNTHDSETKVALEKMLKLRPINILFIDGGHTYEDCKMDFEMYSPLCTDIIAFHDINCHRFNDRDVMQVWRYWDELKKIAHSGTRGHYKQYLFIDIFRYRGAGNGVQMGIGLMIRQ